MPQNKKKARAKAKKAKAESRERATMLRALGIAPSAAPSSNALATAANLDQELGQPPAADDARPSLEFSCDTTGELARQAGMEVPRDYGGVYSQSGKSLKHLDSSNTHGNVPPNIHGDDQFLIKVQLPLEMPTHAPPPIAGVATVLSGAGHGNTTKVVDNAMQALAMVYDEFCTFGRQFFKPADHGAEGEQLVRLIRELGFRGAKAYFLACRDGLKIRVFTDKVMAQPAW